MDIEFMKKINHEYQQELESYLKKSPSPYEQMKRVHEQMIEAKFTLKGKPFPTFLKPLLMPKACRNLFEQTTFHLTNAIEKVANLFFESEDYHMLFEMAPRDKELSMIDPRYPRRVIVGRLDAFYSQEDGLKFLEFNCDSPSGMGWHDALVRIFAETEVCKTFGSKYRLEFDTFLDSLCSMFLTKYREFGGKKEHPVIAVICNEESSIRNDVELIIQHFNQKRNVKTIFADPRDGAYDGERFQMRGEEVDIIYQIGRASCRERV